MNGSISKLITGCWIATHLVEIYCNVGNPQLFTPHAQKLRFLLGGKYLAWGGIILVFIYVQIHLIISNISFSVHGDDSISDPQKRVRN